MGKWLLPGVVLTLAAIFLSPLEPQRAAVGGIRRAVAGGCWLRASLAWERCDPVATTALLKITVMLDGAPRYFWLNGARMMAYDLPVWRSEPGMPAALRRRIFEEQGHAALEFLADGLRAHPGDPDLLIEMAGVWLRLFDDRTGAAQLFRQAAEQPGAPYYAARIHAELLVQLGRPDEALAWLRQILPRLPAGDPAARREIVVQRIKALEAQLGGP